MSETSFFNFEPKEKWFKEDIENISKEVLAGCQKIDPRIKLGTYEYDQHDLSFYIYLLEDTNENDKVRKTTGFSSFDKTSDSWSKDFKAFCRGVKIGENNNRTLNRRIMAKKPERLLELIPEIVKNLQFSFDSELFRKIKKCHCRVRLVKEKQTKEEHWLKLLKELNVSSETKWDYSSTANEHRGYENLQIGSQEITLDKKTYSRVKFEALQSLNIEKFNVNITNIPKKHLIKILEVLRN